MAALKAAAEDKVVPLGIPPFADGEACTQSAGHGPHFALKFLYDTAHQYETDVLDSV